MLPVLFSIGQFRVYSFSLFLLLSWFVFSFVFWRMLRSDGVDEDKIFDLTFYSTLVALVVSRLSFVLFHWELFSDTWLKIIAVWVQPGFSLYGAVLGGLVTLILLSRKEKVRLGNVLDAFAIAFPSALLLGLVGSLLDGTIVGKMASLPWAVRYAGIVGMRHPVQIYEAIACVSIIIVVTVLERRSMKEKWPYGVVGVWFFFLYSTLMFLLEFMKDSRVYWALSANQWVLIALFAETLGAFYVRGGGREVLRPIPRKIKTGLMQVIGGIYAKFSKRRPE
jgi:phosphatidylglycerol:prolipoprotein diacylglycerol transferase